MSKHLNKVWSTTVFLGHYWQLKFFETDWYFGQKTKKLLLQRNAQSTLVKIGHHICYWHSKIDFQWSCWPHPYCNSEMLPSLDVYLIFLAQPGFILLFFPVAFQMFQINLQSCLRSEIMLYCLPSTLLARWRQSHAGTGTIAFILIW